LSINVVGLLVRAVCLSVTNLDCMCSEILAVQAGVFHSSGQNKHETSL